ncbi:MAG: hypothetical protein ACRCUE_07650 [Bosea sp. (in: a-proteobacteria)]
MSRKFATPPILIPSLPKDAIENCASSLSFCGRLRMRISAAALIAAAFLSLAATPASACSCMPRTAAEIAAGADVAIVGTVTEVRRTGSGPNATVIATVSVSRIIKGRIHRQIQLRTPGNAAACGVEFTEGMTIRIAANKLSDGLNTNLCMVLRGPIPAE